jgi:hypothetical protein
MIKFHDVEQNSEEWDAVRLGKFTASSFSDLFMKPDTLGYKKAISNVVYQRISGKTYDLNYSSKRMDAGHELELLAREHYELTTFETILTGGFYEFNEWVGASPDGRIEGKNAGVEFKSRDPHIYFEYLETGKLPNVNKWQVYGQLLCCDFDYIDYMPYCDPSLKTLIIRVERDETILKELENKLLESIEIVKKQIDKYKAS